MQRPVLYSFRRCPYAMRARLALLVCGVSADLREIELRDKAPEFLDLSPDGTVPLLVLPGDAVISESLDIMLWAMEQSDPENWAGSLQASLTLVCVADGPFKTALDRYKYAPQPNIALENRGKAAVFIRTLEAKLATTTNLTRGAPGLADYAIAPFVRQFAHVDIDWFSAQPWPKVNRWLADFKNSSHFATIMGKYRRWQAGDSPIPFPRAA